MNRLGELFEKNGSKGFGRFFLQLLRLYFRVEVQGLENIPKRGRALIVPNHSGFAGADAILLAYIIKRETRRRARMLAHRAFFDFSKKLKSISESHGLKKASMSEGISILKHEQLLILFPEGEAGNFKSTLKRYHLQEFHAGFLRMAVETRSPIVPCLIVGAEESHLNLGNINLSRWIRKTRIPIPLNLVPLPAKWKIVFLPMIPPSTYGAELLRDPKKLRREVALLQKRFQKELLAQAKSRPYVYSPKVKKIVDRLQRKTKKRRRRRRTQARAKG